MHLVSFLEYLSVAYNYTGTPLYMWLLSVKGLTIVPFVQQSKDYESLLFLKLEAGVLPFRLELLAPFIKLCTVRRHYGRKFYNTHICVCAPVYLKRGIYTFSIYICHLIIFLYAYSLELCDLCVSAYKKTQCHMCLQCCEFNHSHGSAQE